MKQLPTIDLAPYLAGGDPTAIAQQIGDACTEFGFFLIANHGVEMDAIDAVYDSLEAFSGEDAELDPSVSYRTTQQLAEGEARLQLNYVAAVEAEASAEYFHRGPRLHGCFPDRVPADHLAFFHPATSVEDLTGEGKPAWVPYFEQSRALGSKILSLFALAVDLPADYFAADFALDASNFTVNEYPARGTVREGGPQIIGRTHTDSGTLTVLHQRGDYEGLEVQLLDDTWIRVPVDESKLIINIGDLMARWSNDRWRSTPHRVIDGEAPDASRKSLVTFYSPSMETVIAPLPTCVGEEGSLYEPISAFEWEAKFLAIRNGQSSASTSEDLVNRTRV